MGNITQTGTGNSAIVDESRKTTKISISIGTVVIIAILAVFFFNRNNDFSLEGKWKNAGESTFGQAQEGAIVIFDGTNCNLYSPKDTYGFYKEDGKYRLDLTSLLFAETMSYEVEVINKNKIEIQVGSTPLILTRVE